jgi:glycerol-3-phosphate dehydrogenase
LEHDVDVVVIGAGIQGAGVAQAAAAAGYRVRVLEQTAIAAATSCRSSKLIHGGLRYLESHQYALVHKTLRERDRLLRLAPHLVQLVPFYIPVYPDTSRRPLHFWLGLLLYALLGGLRRSTRFHTLSRSHRQRLPIRKDRLQSVFQYQDGQTDDVALTRAVMHSAQALGAELICPALFSSAEAKTQGVHVAYQTANRIQRIYSRVLVNASGPWVNHVLGNITPSVAGLAMELVQGTHIVLDNPAPAGVYYVEAPQDQRAVFVMPWHGKTLVGTTETVFKGDPARVAPQPAEIEYLRAVFRHYFPALSDQVTDSFAGLRVLPKLPGSLTARPRDTQLHPEPERVLSLYGGKLTGYRATAEEVMQKLQPYLPPVQRKADTRSLRLLPASGDD